MMRMELKRLIVHGICIYICIVYIIFILVIITHFLFLFYLPQIFILEIGIAIYVNLCDAMILFLELSSVLVKCIFCHLC